jgi:hypothetical protein
MPKESQNSDFSGELSAKKLRSFATMQEMDALGAESQARQGSSHLRSGRCCCGGRNTSVTSACTY